MSETTSQTFNVNLVRPNIKLIAATHPRLWSTLQSGCSSVFANGANTEAKRTVNKIWSIADVQKIESIHSYFEDFTETNKYKFRIDFTFTLKDGRLVKGFINDTYSACDCCFIFEGNAHVSDE